MSTVLPDYSRNQFDLAAPLECDAIMKGGVTSGIIYPYAILEIATKYRFRSLGGTSAGAIAAAFAAAAEYGRQNGRPEAFLTLKKYCDELPDILLSLFQPSPPFKPAADLAKQVMRAGGITGFINTVLKPGFRALLRRSALTCALAAAAGGLVLAIPSWLLGAGAYATILAAILGLVLGGLAALAWVVVGQVRRAMTGIVEPATAMLQALPANNFGLCTGLTEGTGPLAVTDWIHRALQDIAFGNPAHRKPLTFGDLSGAGVDLRVVTTNLSMRRPHTLPRLGAPAGYLDAEWRKILPDAIMQYLARRPGRAWPHDPAARPFPGEAALPVLVAVRMSLSFPVLFTAVPLRMVDTELPSIMKNLGAAAPPPPMPQTALFSDGGISSNFPIHMFDSVLPTRPTFAFSIEELLGDASTLSRRVTVPQSAAQGMGVQMSAIGDITGFAWHVLNSAKDWQDQLLSELTGQRERIARIFLADGEGGLNLNMSPEASRQLMYWGYEAGKAFTNGPFSFDEHKWRRLLVLYRHARESLSSADAIWQAGFGAWYNGYLNKAKSYKGLSKTNRRQVATDLQDLFALAQTLEQRTPFAGLDDDLPRKSGVLKIGPKF